MSGTRQLPILAVVAEQLKKFLEKSKDNVEAFIDGEKTSQGRRPEVLIKHREQQYVLQKYDEFIALSARENNAELGDAIFYEAAFKLGRLTTPGTKNLERACVQYNQLRLPVYIPQM